MSKTIHKNAVRNVALVCAVAFAAALGSLVNPANALAAGLLATSTVNGNEESYYTIDEVLSAGYSGKVIKMEQDWTLTSRLNVGANKSITIDMNGHSITTNKCDQVIDMDNGSHLTLTSSKKETFSYSGFNSQSGEKTDATVTSGGLVTGGINHGFGAGGIDVGYDCELTLDNVAVCGNEGSRGGGIHSMGDSTINLKNGASVERNWGHAGGIFIYKSGVTVNMDNASVSSNFGSSDGGGIYSDADHTKISMTNHSTISSNVADAGGGIYLNYSFFDVESPDGTGTITGNVANKYTKDGGGGIYTDTYHGIASCGYIKNLTITNNGTRGSGGGIYLNQDDTVVSGCTITNNRSVGDGGGVYVGDKGNTMKDCTVTGNVCDTSNLGHEEGGGVFVNHSYDLKLCGKCTIADNLRGQNGSADDLFLSDSLGAHAYILGGVSAGSKVGIRTGMTEDQLIGKNIPDCPDGAYFMDLPSYHLDHGADYSNELWQRVG